VTWLPFDLHPEYPVEGIPRAQLNARYGEEFHDRLRGSFGSLGLVYNPPPDVVPNTMRALRLTELARDQGIQRLVHDRLMTAYWEEGRNIGDPDELLALAEETGLDVDLAAVVVAGDLYRERVESVTADAHAVGVTGVPAFVLDRKLLVLGAQPRKVFEQATDTTTGAEVARRGYAAFNAVDIATLTELMDEYISWHPPSRSPIAGDYRGRDAVFGQFGRYGGDTGGTFKAELEQVLRARTAA
jgi:predicted DsbA family dithiol-disulfide isomerase